MGGRGASSGISKRGHLYGTDYKTVYSESNIKFVVKNRKDAESLMETKTPNRVYVEINNENDIKSIYYMGKNLMRSKTIDTQHMHKEMIPHTHHGYFHNERDGEKGATKLDEKEKKLLEKVTRIWKNKVNK